MEVFWVILGAGAACAFLAFVHQSKEKHQSAILAISLVIAAAVYIGLALYAGDFDFLKIEVVGVLVYGFLAYLGWKKYPFLLGVAWLLHPIWDIGLHLYGEVQGIAPAVYAWMCLAFDVFVAAYIFFFQKKNKKGNL